MGVSFWTVYFYRCVQPRYSFNVIGKTFFISLSYEMFNVSRVCSKFPFFKRRFMGVDVDPFQSLYWICHSVVFLFFFLVWFFGLEARGILAPQPGTELTPPYIGKRSLSHQTTREFPISLFFILDITSSCLLWFHWSILSGFPHAVGLQIAVFQIRHSFPSWLIEFLLCNSHWFLWGFAILFLVS